MSDLSAVTVSRKLSVRFFGDELLLCLNERQKSSTKWRTTGTSRNVSYFLALPLLIGNTEIAFQVISCRGIFEIGSLPLIPGKITTLPVNTTTKGPRRGSSGATHSQNGNHLVRVPSSGSTGSVSYRQNLIMVHFQRLTVFFYSGCRKECSLVC